MTKPEKGRKGRKVPRVEERAVEFDRFAGELERELQRLAWAGNWQIQRTSASVVSNVGEGLDAETMPEKRHYLGIARRGAGEAERLLRAAHARGAVTSEQLAYGLKLLLDIKMDLYRLIEWTKRQEANGSGGAAEPGRGRPE